MGQFNQFCGPSYTAISPTEDVERTVNLFNETIESQAGKNTQILLGAPGLSLFAQVTQTPIRGMISVLNRCFFVAGDTFYELLSGGTTQGRGTVVVNSAPVTMAMNGVNELCIISATHGYIFNLDTAIFTEITASGFLGAEFVCSIDGYFLCAKPLSNIFFISGLNDGLSWDALDFGRTEGEGGYIRSVVANYRELWLICDTHTEVYYDSGDATFPFSRTGGGFIEKGSAAAYSACTADNSIFWLSQDDTGGPQVMRTNGYSATRVSNYALEYAMSQYGVIYDAEAFSYEDAGHVFYMLSFPTADATWCYDVSTQQWHERAYLETSGALTRHRARGFANAFGINLVGDYASGFIYHMDMNHYADNGQLIKRIRIAPHISNELKRNFYDQFQLDAQVGVGLSVAAGQPGYDPQVSLFCSRDGGRTWGPELMTSLGKLGEYNTRVVWRRLGYARDMVFQVQCTEPVKIAWVNAYLQLRSGN